MKLFSSSLKVCIALLACTGAACAMGEKTVSPDGRFTALVAREHSAGIVFSNEDGHKILGPMHCQHAQFSPNSRFIAIQEGKIGRGMGFFSVYATETGERICASEGTIGDFSPDSNLLAVYLAPHIGNPLETSLRLYSTANGESWIIPNCMSVIFNPDGKLVAITGFSGHGADVTVVRTATGEIIFGPVSGNRPVFLPNSNSNANGQLLRVFANKVESTYLLK